MRLLDQGPGCDDHHSADDDLSASNILQACPQMPPLETMHQIASANPRAQANVYLLMQELHFAHVQGFEKLAIGRKVRQAYHWEGTT